VTELIRTYGALTLRACRDRLGRQRGDISFWSIFGGLLLVISYLVYPDMYHDFFGYLFDYLFDALHDAFGGEAPKRTQKGN
jgi:hypothetical protein